MRKLTKTVQASPVISHDNRWATIRRHIHPLRTARMQGHQVGECVRDEQDVHFTVVIQCAGKTYEIKVVMERKESEDIVPLPGHERIKSVRDKHESSKVKRAWSGKKLMRGREDRRERIGEREGEKGDRVINI